MKFIKGVLIFLIVLGVLFIAATPFIIKANKNGSLYNIYARYFPIEDYEMTWGSTIRPYATDGDPLESIDKQYNLIKELFPNDVCVRANIETNMDVNDKLVEAKEQYGTRLYLILEEDIDFNSTDIDYEAKAQALAQKIVARYKGKVEYYQLLNEVTGTIYSKASDTGDKLDAGYGLTVDKTRYNNITTYAKALSQAIRDIDPRARIVLTGNWVLIDPVLSMISDGVDVDIVGWNWGSGLSNEPGIIEIDEYGTMDIPAKVAAIGKKFWIVEANKDDGSYEGKEQEQADYLKILATAARDAQNVQGFFEFTLTDTTEKGAAGALGVVEITKAADGSYSFGPKKPAFDALNQVATGK